MIFNFFKGKSEYTKNILTLVTGTGSAQLIPIIISPILTRLYSPEDFGLIALYLSIVSIISIFATGRYEFAVMLPKLNSEVRAIIRLSCFLALIVSLITFLIVVIFNTEISKLLGNEDISVWLYFIPGSVLLTSFYQLVNYTMIREKQFGVLAKNKVIVSTTNASTQLGVGYFFKSHFGLLLGNVLGQLISIFIIIRTTNVSEYFKATKYPLKKVAYKYKKFPQYDVPSVLMNTLANQMPLLVLGKFFSLSVLGLYSFMYKILMMPINLLSNSILDVFKQKATEDFNNNRECKGIYTETFYKLTLLGVIPFSILGMFAPELFSFIFGDEWKTAGEYAQIMSPMLFLKFIVNPLSYTFYIAQKQNVDLIFQILLFILTFFSLSIGVLFDSVDLTLAAFSAASSIIYLIYLGFSYRYSKGLVENAAQT
tara:strand:+ start:9745 stop:11022 length:1278 start_codon:yes stop_codon:yes gene_type:complete